MEHHPDHQNTPVQVMVIAGNVGVGKTTLAQILARHWRGIAQLISEEPQKNPYLANFCAQPDQWAFHVQIAFLIHRLTQWTHIKRLLTQTTLPDRPRLLIVDRSLEEDGEIFARTLHELGYLSDEDFHTYWKLYEIARTEMIQPSLIVYLRASLETLVRRILQRGRIYERRFTIHYLEMLNRHYEQWIRRWQNRAPHRILIIDADRYDFVHSEDDQRQVLRLIENALGKDVLPYSTSMPTPAQQQHRKQKTAHAHH